MKTKLLEAILTTYLFIGCAAGIQQKEVEEYSVEPLGAFPIQAQPLNPVNELPQIETPSEEADTGTTEPCVLIAQPPVNPIFEQPYSIVVEELTPEVLEACQKEENCMDVTSVKDATCPDSQIWSDEMEECIEVFYCDENEDCGPYAECIGRAANGKGACLPI